ncbi:hypothetical protein LCGC14_1479870 [marine sediment metagenome]|uniref:Uncharacterized protein n=1 Tax=marine sediment metagenome TaxID=412755 RepID=A0A0F9LQ92_9ZZZZ
MVSNELKTLYIYLLKYNWHVHEYFEKSEPCDGTIHICLFKPPFVGDVYCINFLPM